MTAFLWILLGGVLMSAIALVGSVTLVLRESTLVAVSTRSRRAPRATSHDQLLGRRALTLQSSCVSQRGVSRMLEERFAALANDYLAASGLPD